jgi:DNA-binding beta-propeller fold protein YncE
LGGTNITAAASRAAQAWGRIVGKKLRTGLSVLGAGLAAACLLWSSGCGGKGATANVIKVTISSQNGLNLILGVSTNLTATVTGATNTDVTWEPGQPSGTPCTYTTTTVTNGKSTTSKEIACPTDGSFGTLSNTQTTGTATYNAPNQLPDQTKFPGLAIIISAASVQSPKIIGKITLTLSSGIRVVLNPVTATVPTKEQQPFNVQLFNDLQSKNVTWLLTQNVPSTTNGVTTNFPKLPTCSPSCGTITPDTNNPNLATYAAPDTVPTAITPAQKNNTNAPENVTIVATSNADNAQFALGTITIIAGGPITFNGITPTIAPQGATLWDIYLDAPNISSASQITLTDSSGGKVTKDSTSGQIKVLFPIPTTTTMNPSSTGARLRLFAQDLGNSGPFTVSVTDPAEPCNGIPAQTPCTAMGVGTFNIIPVRPTSIASVPDDVVQGKLAQDTRVIIDGGYFGPTGSNLTAVTFQNSGVSLDASSTSRQLVALLPATQINNNNPPGLYPLSVSSRATPLPFPDNPSVTNMAVFPDYSLTPPAVISGPAGIPAGTNPTAVDIDPALGVLVVAEAGSSTAVPPVPGAIQFYTIGKGTLTLLSTVQDTPQLPINLPTGISVDRTNHSVAVVNYGSLDSKGFPVAGSQSVTVFPIPGAPGTPVTAFSVDISGALQGSVSPAPMPYSIAVDPDSHLALVAYSSTSSSSAANLGFIVNLNANTADSTGKATNPYGCILGQAINSTSNAFGQCLFAQVTLNTGVHPQVATAQHGHQALVTPGGGGSSVVRGIDVTKPSTANVILSSKLTAGLVTVTVDTTTCPTGVAAPTGSTGCPFTMVPGNAGTVLITNVKPANSANDASFNGVFSVNVISSNSFTYVVNSTASDTGSGGCDPTTKVCATVFYAAPDQIFGVSPTLQGIAINPITHTAALADANATGINGPQIDLLSSLDQSLSSIFFHSACTAFTTTCPGAPEFLGTTVVAWQPYTNAVVSYNPTLNQVSISDPVSRQRFAFACASSSACQVNPVIPSQVTLSGTGTATLTVQNGTTNSLTLFGGVAVDPATNQAFILKSGSGSIDIVDLGGPGTASPPKAVHISEILVPSPTSGTGAAGGVPKALVPQATLTSANPLSGVQIFGSGFTSGVPSSLQVLLDGVDITTKGGTIDKITSSGREVDVTIPPVFLSMPHHFSLQVVNNGVPSNSLDFIVVQALDLTNICPGTGANPQPSSVAIADQIANGPFSPIALVSLTGCNSVAVIDLNPTVAGTSPPQRNPQFGQLIGNPVGVGTNPQGIAISQHLGLAVVANHGSNNASILDLTPLSQSPPSSPVQKVPDISTGTNPTGVAINDATGAAIVTNFGSNTISMINLGLLFPPSGTTPPTTLTPISIGGIQQPLAVAIDPDRGSNDQGIAVVTGVQLVSGSAPLGELAVVDIGLATPAISSAISSGAVAGTATGIVFDPAVVTNTANPGVFFANSSGSNVITSFNPDGGQSSVNVGINPTSLAVNSQTGAILTSNSASNTISIVDTLSNPFKTRQTLGFPGSPTFGVAIDQFTNLAVIVDQANNRVLLFPMPN